MQEIQTNSLYIRRSRETNKKYYLSVFLAVVLITFAISGYTAKSANYILLSILFLWYISAFLSAPSNFIKIFRNKISLAFMGFIIFYFIICLISSGVTNTIKYVGHSLILFSPFIIYLYYSKLKDKKLLKFILTVTIVFWVIFAIRALMFYQQNESAARILASDRNAFDSIAIGGGYGLAYGSAFLCIYLLDCFINKRFRRPKYKLYAVIAIALLFATVIETKSTVTLLGMIFGIALCVTFHLLKKGSNKRITLKSIVWFLLMCIMFIVLIINTESIGTYIMRQTDDKRDTFSIRLYEVGATLANNNINNGESADFNIRMELIKKSATTFLENPIIGVGYKYGYISEYSAVNGVGNHSEWTDSLAKYGLIGGIPYLLIFAFIIKNERRNNIQAISSAFIFVVVFLGFFNPFLTAQSNIALFFIIPATTYLSKVSLAKENMTPC
ncbi:MAG: O-antigen ligase family protein [Eubacteriales bacterium]|nr:O-antigen ligase family protein [Eubacteriales bacterium]